MQSPISHRPAPTSVDDPAAFGRPAVAGGYFDTLVDFVHATTRLNPAIPVLVTGEQEDIARAPRADRCTAAATYLCHPTPRAV